MVNQFVKTTRRRSLMKRQGYALAMIIVISATLGISKDFGILTRMLYAAFLAEQGAAICVVADPAFASETTGPLGDIHSYVQHIKAEVTAGLSENDTLSLLKSSADIAKAESQQAIRGIRAGGEQGTETERFAKWCQVTVKPFVQQVIETHDNHHAQIEQLLEKAKKD